LALNIDIICANSPQAKGRIERAFGTLQDRMVKRCYGASGEDEASSSLYTTDGDAPCRSRMT
jgi:hypothetical protein